MAVLSVSYVTQVSDVFSQVYNFTDKKHTVHMHSSFKLTSISANTRQIRRDYRQIPTTYTAESSFVSLSRMWSTVIDMSALRK